MRDQTTNDAKTSVQMGVIGCREVVIETWKNHGADFPSLRAKQLGDERIRALDRCLVVARAAGHGDIPFTLAPTDLALHVVIEKADLDALDAAGGPGRYLAQRSRDWLEIWTAVLGARGFSPFDALATLIVASPDKVSREVLPAAIVDLPDASFRGTGKSVPRLVVSAALDSPHRVKFCAGASADAKAAILTALPRGATPP